jgi:hypothetical protein
MRVVKCRIGVYIENINMFIKIETKIIRILNNKKIKDNVSRIKYVKR